MEANFYSTENILLFFIGCITFVAVLFFVMTLMKKINRIRENKLKTAYQEKIDYFLFGFIFNDEDLDKIKASPDFKELMEKPLFQKLSIKAIKALHNSYSGIYKEKLEKFYLETGLVKYSFKKLESGYWPLIVEGIRDLSSLNVKKAYPRIVSYKNHNNASIKTEVLLGMIKLKGITELYKFKNSKVYFDDWQQSNILFVIKNNRINPPEDLSILLESQNKSIVLLAVRLINYFNHPDSYNALSQMYQSTTDQKLKKEIAIALNKTEQLK